MSNDNLSCPEHMENVLIVEDSKTFASLLRRNVTKELGVEPVCFTKYSSVQEHLKECSGSYFAALLDLNLPDAPDGEIVDLVIGHGVPSIVFTSEMSDDMRDRMWGKHIVDYVLKENLENIEHVIELIKRLKANRGMQVLVADDSSTSRKLITDLLEIWNFTVLQARDGQEALDILQRENDIKMLLADYNMPKVDGVKLIREARRTFSKNRLPIIGLSGMGGATMTAHFLKAGANDYMHKPFLAEELYCRVRHNIETAEYIATIKELAERDFLTGLFNRRSFFSVADKLFAKARREHGYLTVAMLDIDYFKHCNDRYGHDAGDMVIRSIAQTLQHRFRDTDLVARFGGEEYCLACPGMDGEQSQNVFEDVRSEIENTPILIEGQSIRVTVSIGVCATLHQSLQEMITSADNMLYLAKEKGRNQVRMAG